MTYLEAIILRTYVQALPKLASREFSHELARAQVWMVQCLADDRLMGPFGKAMRQVEDEMQALRTSNTGSQSC